MRPRVSLIPGLRTASSTLAVGLVLAPFVLGGALAFPLWDDGQLWLMMKEKGASFIMASFTDRPVNAWVWASLAQSDLMLWAAPLATQAVLWSLLAFVSARLWVHLFPELARYAWVAAALSVSAVLSKVQVVLASVAVAALPPVVLAYIALLLVLGYVTNPGLGMLWRGALPLSAVVLAMGVLLQEYALPVAAIAIVLLLPHLWWPADAAARKRAVKGILTVAVTTVVAYAAYRAMADPMARTTVDPASIFSLNPRRLVLIPFTLAMAVWRGVVVTVVTAVADVTTSLSIVWPDAPRPEPVTVVRAAYGLLVAGLLLYGSRAAIRSAGVDRLRLLTLFAALVVGLFPVVVMGRVPWDPGDGMASRFGLPVLPIATALILRSTLALVSPRLWALPVIVLGFTAGSLTVADVWEAVRERQTLATLGRALEPRVAAMRGLSVAVVSLPERALGPRRQWELTARLAATWPAELRERFWAYRVGGGPPLFYREEATLIFGSRQTCRAPKTITARVRKLEREGEVGQLLFVAPGVNGSVVIEPYCLRDD